MNITIPVPTNFLEWAWMGIGINFGRAFGKQLDQTIQNTNWYKKLKPYQQWIIARLLDATHHWWIGALLMVYIAKPEIFWFGTGLLLDDVPDIPLRIRKILEIAKELAENKDI